MSEISIQFTAFMQEFESFVGVNFWTMIFAWVNLLILYLLMKKYLFGPIRSIIEERQKDVDAMYLNAEETEKRADEMKSEYEEKLEGAKAEGEEIIRDAQRRATLRGESIVKEAEAEADRIIERAEADIELERRRVVNEVKSEVAGMAISIAEAVIERDVSEDEHKDLIDSFIEKMGDEK